MKNISSSYVNEILLQCFAGRMPHTLYFIGAEMSGERGGQGAPP
jgi:hypothetical protein